MKKNIISVLLGAAVITLFAGCNKEQLADVEITGAKVVKATIEAPATKTTLDRGAHGGKIAWVEGENIKINGCVYKCHVDPSNPTVATFEADGMAAVPDENGKYVAVYPYNLKNDSGELVLDATQLWQGNNMGRVFPMVAETDNLDNGLEFKNVCGLLEISLKGSRTVSSIRVCDQNLGMSGAFTVDANGNAVLKNPTDKTSVLLNCGNVQLTPEGVTFYIAVPAGTYSKLKIFIDSNDGIRANIQAVKEAVIERSKIYHLEFTPNLGTDEHECVQLWANGPYWSTKYIGASSVTSVPMFFMWGATNGYIWNGNEKAFNGVNSGFAFNEQFWDWTVNIDQGDTSNPTKLDASHDAASVIWGNGWRMPTLDEITQLKALDGEYDPDSKLYYIFSSINETDALVLSLLGYANESARASNGACTGFWTNECRGKNSQAHIFYITPSAKTTNAQKVWTGWPILPVRDTPLK